MNGSTWTASVTAREGDELIVGGQRVGDGIGVQFSLALVKECLWS